MNSTVSGNIQFFDEPYAPRVYYGAPADTSVLTVNACRYIAGGCTPDPITYTIGGADAAYFKVDPQTAVIQTSQAALRPLGQLYRILIYATYYVDGQNVVENRQVRIFFSLLLLIGFKARKNMAVGFKLSII